MATGLSPWAQGQENPGLVQRELQKFLVNFNVDPKLTDLTPLGYGIWGFVESRACAKPHSNVASLKTSVKKK